MAKAKRKTKKKAAKKSGRVPWTEERYAAEGIASLKIRIPKDALELLTKEAVQVEESRAVYAVTAIRERAARRKLSQ